jgi:polar amino acid transport system substrate-binding protein
MSVRLLVILLLIAAALPGADRLAGIAARGRLVVAQYAGERFPFFFNSPDGVLLGQDVELARELARTLGVELELRRSAGTFDEVVTMVARGEADLGLSKLSATLERARRVRFSQPYLVQNEALLVNRLLSARTHGQEILAACRVPGARIGVVRGTSFEASLREVLPGAVAESFDRPEELLTAVVRGSLLAAYHDEVVFACLLRLRPQASLWAGLATLPGRQDRLAIAVPGDDPQLAAWVDLFIELRCRPPAVGALLDRWMPPADAPRPPVLAGFERIVDAAQERTVHGDGGQQPRSFATLALATVLLLVLGLGWGGWRLAIRHGGAA